MIAPTIGLYVVLATSTGMVPSVSAPIWEACGACDAARVEVQRRIDALRSGSGLIASRKAARALGGCDWRLYPEAAEALADALLNDSRPLVRQQAASSLARMRPGLPMVQAAVALAARDDSALLARHAAKRALRAIDEAAREEGAVALSEGPEIILPRDVGSAVLSPAATGSPFAPGANYEVPVAPPAPPPSIQLEDSRPLPPPIPDFDQYYPNPVPFHGEIQPDDAFLLPTDFPAPAAWPTESWFPRVPLYPRPNYASSLLGDRP